MACAVREQRVMVMHCSLVSNNYYQFANKFWHAQNTPKSIIIGIKIGLLQSPLCITWLLNVPSTVANAVLWTCSGTMHICSYASDISSFDRYATLAISLRMISWSGNGVTSLTVLSFCSHKLKTVRSLPFFFGMQSIGTT